MRSILQKRILTSFFLTLVVFSSFLVPFSSLKNLTQGDTTIAYAAYEGEEDDVEGDGLSGLPSCHPLNGWGPGSGSLMGCMAMLAYYILFRPASVIAFLAASFLDFFIGYSLSDTSYRNPFVEIGWKLIRDISNIAFILVLLYVAIQGMFTQSGGAEFKKALPKIILMAILINFSLFFTRVIIDVSNITSRVFYNSIEVTKSGTDDPANLFGTKSVSTAIATSINPQRILSGVQIQAGSVIEVPGRSKEENAEKLSESEHASFYIIVILASVVICLVMAWVFFSSAFIFLGRVVGFYFAMIFSPFAFMSRIYPDIGKTKQIGWDAWVKNVTELAFVGPIFTFYLYLTAQFAKFSNQVMEKMQTNAGGADTAFAQGTVGTGANGFFPMLFGVMIPMAIITALLMLAQKAAKSHAGIIGEMATKVGSVAGGLALGAVTGGASLALRNTLGASAARKAADPELQRRAAEGDKEAQAALDKYKARASRSYDLRNTKVAGVATDIVSGKGGNFMKDLDKNILKGAGLAKDSGKGGYQKKAEEKVKKNMEDATKYMLTGQAASEQDKKAKEWKEEYEKALENARKAGGANFDQIKFKEEYEKGRNIYTNTAVAEKVKTSKEINSKSMRDKANEIEYGKSYNKDRDEAEKQARAAGQKFDEKAWRKGWLAQNPQSELSVADKETIYSLRKKAGEDEVKPISKKEKAKMNNQLNQANQKIQDIEDLLSMVSKLETGNPDAHKNLSQQEIQQHINSALKKIDNDTITHDTTILMEQQKLAAAADALRKAKPGSTEYVQHETEVTRASSEIVKNQREKKEKEEQIKNLKNLWRDQLDAVTKRDEAEDKLA